LWSRKTCVGPDAPAHVEIGDNAVSEAPEDPEEYTTISSKYVVSLPSLAVPTGVIEREKLGALTVGLM